MTENATAPVNTDKPAEDAAKPAETVTPELTQEQKDAIFAELPATIQEAITTVNDNTAEHNSKVDSLKASEAKDPKLIKAEIFEQNPQKNKKIQAILDEYRKLEERMEKLRMGAYEVIETDGLMPKELTDAELNGLKTAVQESTKDLKDSANALLKFEEMMPAFKGKIGIHLAEIKTRRGAAKTGATTSKGTEGQKRPRFKKIEINGVTQDDSGNTVFQKVGDDERFTFTFAAQYLNKQHKNLKVTPSELQDKYYEGMADENNPPEIREFVYPHTFKNEAGHEHTVNYTFKCYR